MCASAAYADGVCVKGYRDTTAAERQTMLTVMETAKAALPVAPPGWVIGGYEELSPVGSICKDGENTPWSYGFSRTFNRTDDQAARDQAMADAGAKVRAAQEARQPRIDALMARSQTLGAELGAAAQKGDQARVDAINREIEKISRQYAAIMAEGDDPAVLESIAKATMQDRTMSIGIRVNPGAISNADMKKSQAPAGAQSAYRWTTSADGVSEGHVLLLFGAWQPRADGRSRIAATRNSLVVGCACGRGHRGGRSGQARFAAHLDRLRRDRGNRRALTARITSGGDRRRPGTTLPSFMLQST
jgi:hypothetical protein